MTKIFSLITVQTLGEMATGVAQPGSLLQREKHRPVIVIDVKSKATYPMFVSHFAFVARLT